MDKKTLKAFIEKIDGKMVAIATDETVDRHGDSLPVDAWDFKNYKKNPVLQFAHNYNRPPIGIAKKLKKDGDRITFEPHFHEFTEEAREVKKLFEEGIMQAFSVGFIPHTEGEGEGAKMRLELLEISAVPVPANPSAVVIEKALEQNIKDEAKQEITAWVKKEIDVNVVDEKAGKVLSKKSRNLIQEAVSVLGKLLEADLEKEDAKPKTLKVYTEKSENIKQGRSPGEDISLETISNQLGELNRRLKKANQ